MSTDTFAAQQPSPRTLGTDAGLPTPRAAWRLDAPLAYEPIWHEMRTFSARRGPQTPDEFWLLAHARVFTQGTNGRAEHLLMPGDIPVVQTDRGGQVTYHGPGQLMVYTLVDIQRLGIGVRSLVTAIEQAMITTLGSYGIQANARPDAPGVYVDGAKIGSIGLRIRQGHSYHGLALNVDMDLEPFSRIDPCGFEGLRMTQISDLAGPTSLAEVAGRLLPALTGELRLPAALTAGAN